MSREAQRRWRQGLPAIRVVVWLRGRRPRWAAPPLGLRPAALRPLRRQAPALAADRLRRKQVPMQVWRAREGLSAPPPGARRPRRPVAGRGERALWQWRCRAVRQWPRDGPARGHRRRAARDGGACHTRRRAARDRLDCPRATADGPRRPCRFPGCWLSRQRREHHRACWRNSCYWSLEEIGIVKWRYQFFQESRS